MLNKIEPEVDNKIIKNELNTLVRFMLTNGASEENRTPISTLARLYINHYTTPALHKYNIKKIYDLQVYFIHISCYNYSALKEVM